MVVLMSILLIVEKFITAQALAVVVILAQAQVQVQVLEVEIGHLMI